MKKLLILALAATSLSFRAEARAFKLTAHSIAVDRNTKTMVATGKVMAVSAPLTMRSEKATRDANGVVTLTDPTTMTSCTNEPGTCAWWDSQGYCHWDLRGEVEYLNDKYLIGRNVWLDFYEMPVFWIPYFYYPLDGECALRMMPGYTSRWGAYLMTKVVYDICGDSTHQDNTYWLYGNTRFDLRYVNGIGLGQSLDWNLGDFGRGHFKIYYAWDEDYDRYQNNWNNSRHWNYSNWESSVNRDRYQMELEHRWDVTERDQIHLQGMITSDSAFQRDFFRSSSWMIANDWIGNAQNEVAWEHTEDPWGTGISVSGPLNEFYTGTSRLPEWYFDVAPQSVFGLPFNYESENRAGYLARQPAEYGSGNENNPYAYVPGRWANYATFRFDTYHRLTAPFKVADVLSVVPRMGYRGTFWNDCGKVGSTGWETAGKHNGNMYRSILEGGVTFAGRGKAWITDRWQHMIEPYFDVLAQKAWCAGNTTGERPYIFDSLDASVDWQDQFAGRSRNLPYTYYGVTPGWRNAWSHADDKGNLRTIADFDVYAALQFNHGDWYGENDEHKLARLGYPNYGKHGVYTTPGARLRFMPDDSTTIRIQSEYDPDRNRLAYTDLEWRHKPLEDFSYYVRYTLRDYRRWDFNSVPYKDTNPNCTSTIKEDAMNRADYKYVTVGFEHQPLNWFAWSPYMRWDCRENELAAVGSWFDYLTDCLGFRLVLEYDNSYTRIDGSEYDEDFDVGFFIYLRALGASNNPFNM